MPAVLYRDPRTGQTVPKITAGSGGVTDHGALTGLTDDDHAQYLTNARGDARYVNTTGDTMTGPINAFASAAARDTAIPAPVEGMMCYLKDTGTQQQHNGFVWVGDPAWTTCTMLNGWVASDPVPMIRMDYRGKVLLEGLVGSGAASTSGVVLSFPVKYTPAVTIYRGIAPQGGVLAGTIPRCSVAGGGGNTLTVAQVTTTGVLLFPLGFEWWSNFQGVR